jgi:cytochrome c biogenesis protein CcdA
MLPAYVFYYLDKGDQKGSLSSGLILAVSMVAGFLLVFVVIGVILSLAVSEFIKWVWGADPVIGAGLIGLGVLTGWTRILERLPRIGFSADGNKLSFLAFGVAYGVASLGCSLPVFILVVVQGAAAGGLSEIFTLFAVFMTGAAALIIPLTLALTLTNELIHERLLAILPYMNKINAVVLIAAGAYMIYTYNLL